MNFTITCNYMYFVKSCIFCLTGFYMPSPGSSWLQFFNLNLFMYISDDLIDNDGLFTYILDELNSILDKYARMLGNLCQIDSFGSVSFLLSQFIICQSLRTLGHHGWIGSIHVCSMRIGSNQFLTVSKTAWNGSI